jgi:ubiquinone/menaquinone biosynthesis C-methylase UbiE
MNLGEYKAMFELESFYWWYIARRKVIGEFLTAHLPETCGERRILDVGCGTGINNALLSQFGEVHGADMSEAALEFSRKRGIRRLQLASMDALGYPSKMFHAATALDILEHTDDDMAALKELHRVMDDNGKILLTVPAYGFLWSEHDEALHHRRRYTSAELRNKLTVAGFDIERCTYYITLLFLPILLMRIAQNFRKRSIYPTSGHVILPRWLNRTLIWVLDFERVLLRWTNLPMGVSIVCVARKRSETPQYTVLPLAQVQAGEAADRVATVH